MTQEQNLDETNIPQNVEGSVDDPSLEAGANTTTPNENDLPEEYDASNVPVAAETEFPKKRYQARVIKTEAGKSAKGHPMVTLECEILGQDGKSYAMTSDNKRIPVVGKKFNLRLLYILPSGSKQGSIGFVVGFNRALGIDMPKVKVKNPEHEIYKGKTFDIVLSSEPMIAREAPDKSKGEKLGKAITDRNGKEIVTGHRIQADLSNVLGPASFMEADASSENIEGAAE